MRRLVAVAIVTTACSSLSPHGQVLSVAYTKGATYHYTIRTTYGLAADSGAMTKPYTFDIQGKETITVVSVDSSGVADVRETLTDVTETRTYGAASATDTHSSLPPARLKVEPSDGRLLSIDGANVPADFTYGAGGGALVSSLLLPKVVKPGDTWSKRYDVPSPYGAGRIHITTKSRYLRDETFHGVHSAVVETTTTAGIDVAGTVSDSAVTIKGAATTDVTVWIDPSAHQLLKSSLQSSSQMVWTGAAMHAVTGSQTMTGSASAISELA